MGACQLTVTSKFSVYTYDYFVVGLLIWHMPCFPVNKVFYPLLGPGFLSLIIHVVVLKRFVM